MAEQGWTLPDWLALHVGRLSVELEYLRYESARLLREADEVAKQSPPQPDDPS